METIYILLIVSCLFLLGSSRLRVAIRVVAVQGVLLGLLALIRYRENLNVGILLLIVVGILCKGILLPWLMSWVLRYSGIRREVEPFVGFGLSLLIGVAMLGASIWITVRLHLEREDVPPLMVATALFILFVGFFLMVTRRKAITQSLAYLILENGVYAIGVSISVDFPLVVELGILLDVFVGVFLMGNLLFHLDREFDHIDADRLSELSESPGAEAASHENHI